MLDIIIPVYNPGVLLEGCLKSCFTQTYRGEYRVTLVDDGSTETIEPFIAPYIGRIQLIRLKNNRGAAHARNVGIGATSGDLILFQDADDRMTPERLQLTVNAFEKNRDLVMVCGNFCWVIEGKATPLCFKMPPELFYATLLVHFPINICTVGLKRSILETTGIFEENYPVAEDYDLWMRILKAYPEQIGYIPEQLSFYHWCATESSLTKKYRHTQIYQKILGEISRKYGAL